MRAEVAGTAQTITASDGTRLVFDDEGQGRAVVLVHCYSGRRDYWSFQRQPLLDAGYRVVAIDLRSHGDSELVDHGQRISRYGQDIRELLDALDLDDVALVAHSFGAAASFAMFSVSGTRRVTRFVDIDQTPKIINDGDWTWGLPGVRWDNVWDCVNFRAEWGNFDREPSRPAHVHEQWPDIDARWESFPHARVRPALADHFVADWRDLLPCLALPTWIATSRFSPVSDVEGMAWLASAIPNGSLTVFEESGHYPQMNEPERFNAELLAFLAD